MKLAITGKGGVGKTTFSAVLAHLYASDGKRVLAVDADPDTNLAGALGLTPKEAQSIKPVAEMTELIAQRTGARPGSSGGVFRLNPKVDDIPGDFGMRIGNITLLITGRSKEAASGCFCPESTLLRRLLRHLVVERDEVVIMDMEAGIEHLTRGTSESMDAFIVLVEPGKRSLQTAMTVKELAADLGVKHVYVVANKVRSDKDVDSIRTALNDIELLGSIGFNDEVVEADLLGDAPFDKAPKTVSEVRKIRTMLEKNLSR